MKKAFLERPSYVSLLSDFTAWLRALGYARSSIYNMGRYVRALLLWLEANELELEEEAVSWYLHTLTDRVSERRGKPLSLSSLKGHHQAVKLLARYLMESGQGRLGVPSLEQVVEREPATPAGPVVLTRAEVRALYRACSDDGLGVRDRCMLSLYYGCGLRSSEGVALSVEDVLFERSCVYVRQTKTRRERYVPMVGWVHEHLRDYLQEVRPRWAQAQEQAFLVSRQYGQRMAGRSMAYRLVRLSEQAGFEEALHLHSLRHSVATHLLEAGLPLERVAQFLGHRSLESTQLYTHLVDERDP